MLLLLFSELIAPRLPPGGVPVIRGGDVVGIVSDEAGGAYVVVDNYVIRIGKGGRWKWDEPVSHLLKVPLWTVKDTEGGVIFVGNSNYDEYIQRVDSLGHLMWGDTGVCLFPSVLFDSLKPLVGYPGDLRMASDSQGGAYALWQVCWYGPPGDINFRYAEIMAQHINSLGDTLWGGMGKLVKHIDSTAYAFGWFPLSFTSWGGGCAIAWCESTDSHTTRYYLQCLDSSGNFLCDSSGAPTWFEFPVKLGMVGYRVGLCDSGYLQTMSVTGESLGFCVLPETAVGIEDGVFRTYSRWFYYLWRQGDDLYIQRVDTLLFERWDSVDVPVIVWDSLQDDADFCVVEGGAVYVVWRDRRHGRNEVYVQFIDSLGRVYDSAGIWVGDGVPCGICPDGHLGCFVFWTFNDTVYVQRVGPVSSVGPVAWFTFPYGGERYWLGKVVPLRFRSWDDVWVESLWVGVSSQVLVLGDESDTAYDWVSSVVGSPCTLWLRAKDIDGYEAYDTLYVYVIEDTISPDSFLLVYPVGDTVYCDTVEFLWRGSEDGEAGLSGYGLYVDGVEVYTGLDTCYSGVVGAGEHCWWVVACDSAGNEVSSDTVLFWVVLSGVFEVRVNVVGVLLLEGYGRYEVYDVVGRKVKEGVVRGEERVVLPSGVYFVRTGRETRKVMVIR